MPKKRTKSYIYTVGRRKTSVARVRILQTGTGEVTINGKPLKTYFPHISQQRFIGNPTELLSAKTGDITIKVQGGGKQSQAEAIRHGIARALVEINPEYRTPLKKAGFLRRDPREKERKKPGLRRARRARQWSKR
jgi:small subunit ribosomal protein S9